jgi:hypothetical protein
MTPIRVSGLGLSRPLVPLDQVVLKVHSRCDLACDHCYVYEAADQSWREGPMVVSEEVTAQAEPRIGEHAAAHLLSARSATTGPEYAQWLIAIVDRWLADGCPLPIRTPRKKVPNSSGKQACHARLGSSQYGRRRNRHANGCPVGEEDG